MKRITFLVLIPFILVLSCTKDKPPIGQYHGLFNGSYMDGDSLVSKLRSESLFIIESYKESIYMSSVSNGKAFALQKGNKKTINGTIDIVHSHGIEPGYYYGPIHINGHWEREGNEFFIHGEFSYQYEIIQEISKDSKLGIIDRFTVNGDFEIKSENLDYFN